jgi:hypothetical protein
MRLKLFLAAMALTTSNSVFCDSAPATKKYSQPYPSVGKQVGTIQVQFDVTRVIAPTPIPNANNPTSWRAYLPSCPPGSKYVSGVNPNWLALDPGPNYPYCNCICKGNCSRTPGLTSPGGNQPIYTATVTCSATVQGWFNSSFFPSGSDNTAMLANLSPVPHQYYYCQSGNCGTNPLPANLNYSVPIGGYTNTTQINFQACTIASNNICGAPDPTVSSRYQ